MYPKAILINCKNKAKIIKKKKEQGKQKERKKDKRSDRIMVVPHSEEIHRISKGLSLAGVTLLERTGRKIGDMVRYKEKNTVYKENSIVYRVPCGGCHKSYIGETYRGLKTRVTEHKRDLKFHRVTNSIVLHAEEEDHLPKWEKAEAVKKGMTRKHRKIIESALIESVPCTNHRGGFYTLGSAVCHLAFEKYIKEFYS